MKRKTIILIAFVSFLALCGQAPAQVVLEQGLVVERIEPGKSVTGSITVHNQTREDKGQQMKIYAEDFEYIPPFKGKKKFFPSGTLDNSCSEWISFSPSDLKVPPHTKRKVNYRIAVPEDASGGYQCVLFFEGVGESEEIKDVGLKLVTRVGTVFFLDTQDRSKKSEIIDVAIKERAIAGTMVNEGNTLLVAKGIYFILDEEGLAIARDKVAALYIPVKEKADFAIELPKGMKRGRYSTVATFDLREGDSLVAEVEFEVKKDGQIVILNVL